MGKFVLAPAVALLALGLATVPLAAHADRSASTPQVLPASSAPHSARTTKGDVLLMKRVRQERHMRLPTHGMTKQQVLRQFGKPLRKLDPRGGDAPQHPVIYRWQYPKYIVYLEYDHVIHTVLNTPAGNNRRPKTRH